MSTNGNLDIPMTDELLALLRERLSSEEQLSFLESFYVYLTHDPVRDFVVDLEDVYEWVGFTRKDNAKRNSLHYCKFYL